MTTRTLRAARVLAGAALALGLAACGATDPDPSPEQAAEAGTTAPPSSTTFNDADVMFAAMMIPHHAQAVEMSQIILDADGVDPAVVDLATRIRDAQAPEIELMTTWLGEWGAEDAMGADHSGHGMDGMLAEEDLDAIAAAGPADAARLFLERMIQHHEGAVAMAEDELASGENPGALALAEQIVAAQQAEITEMTDLLAELAG